MKLNKENRERCGKIIKLNPRDFQLQIAQEELAELIQAISKYLRYGEIEPLLEEYADVEVIMEELRQMFDIQQKEIDNRCAKKLWRALDGRVLINANVEGNRGTAHVKR